LDEFAEVLHRYDELEDVAKSATDYFALLQALAPVQRTAQHCHQVLQDARQKCTEDRDLIDLRDRAYENERRAELLYQGAKNSLEFYIAKRTEEQAESGHKMALAAHRLNILVALFFPIATLSSVFGVNLLHGLEESPPPYAFLGLVAVGLLGGIFLTYYPNRRSR
jgi:Mg2+ and Co2+ transporter CorA